MEYISNKEGKIMEKFKEIRISIPLELYEKFRKNLKNEYIKPTEFIRRYIVEYVKECENDKK